MSTAYRHAFLMGMDPTAMDFTGAPALPANGMFNNYVHLDAHNGSIRSSWAPGPAATVQEPVFAPRGPGAQEGDGYLLGLINRHDEVRSDLVILDTAHLDDGPVAIARLPFRMKNALHGSWADASEFTRRS